MLRVARNDAYSAGRSMIEMLGVLAIVAVLSVGGIAGYSKAMKKWKIDKAIGEYSMLIFGILEHLQDFKKLEDGTNFNSFLKDINLVPRSWKYTPTTSFFDSLGNNINIFLRNNKLTIDMYLGGFKLNEKGNTVSANFSHKLCTEFMQNITLPLHSTLYHVWIHNVDIFFTAMPIVTELIKNVSIRYLYPISINIVRRVLLIKPAQLF